MVVLDGVTVIDPLAPKVPTPEMVTEVALVDDQISVLLCPAVIVVGLAVNCTVGGGFKSPYTMRLSRVATYTLPFTTKGTVKFWAGVRASRVALSLLLYRIFDTSLASYA